MVLHSVGQKINVASRKGYGREADVWCHIVNKLLSSSSNSNLYSRRVFDFVLLCIFNQPNKTAGNYVHEALVGDTLIRKCYSRVQETADPSLH